MNGFIEALQKVLMPIAAKMNASKYIRAMRDGFVLSLAYTMVGSILTSIFAIPALTEWFGADVMGKIQAFVNPTTIMTNSIISIFVVVGIGYSFAKQEGGINPLHGAATALVMFLMTCPYTIELADGRTITGLDFSYVGAKAIFTAIFFGFIGVKIYKWAVEHKLSIKLPDSVPASIQDSFTSFLPAGMAMLVSLIIRALFAMTPQGNMTDFIFYWVQKPLSGIALSLPAMLLMGMLNNLFWFFGLHGQTMVSSVWRPFLTQASTENIEALAAGQSLPNLINGGFSNAFIMYGFWISIPLLIALFLYTKKHKRNDWKDVSKISLAPGLFNIYEPLMFGFPLVLNPFALIPMLLTPIISCTVGYFCCLTGIMPYATGVGLPITTPVVVSGLLQYNSVTAGLIQLLLMVPLAAMWYLFLGIQDRAERQSGIYKEEEEANAAK